MLGCGLCLLAILSLPKFSICEESDFEEDVDSIIRRDLGDDGLKHGKYFENMNEDLKNISLINSIITYNNYIKNNKQNDNITRRVLSGNDSNYLIETLVKDKMRIILNRDSDRVKDAINNVDGFDKLTKTLKELKKESPIFGNGGRRSLYNNYNPMLDAMLYDAQEVVEQLMNDNAKNKSLLRSKNAYYHHFPRTSVIPLKERSLKMIYTHTYRAQHYVALAQTMRARYIDHPRYKLGFCFCLLKEFLHDQNALIRGFDHYFQRVHRTAGILISWALYTFGKIQRLERDIRDILHHIKDLEYQRKMKDDPNYYNYWPSSTGRHSG